MNLAKTTIEFNTVTFMQDIRNSIFDTGKFSLHDIAALSGVSASTLSRIDNGATPDMQTFLTLCEYFELDTNRYFERVEWTGKVTNVT